MMAADNFFGTDFYLGEILVVEAEVEYKGLKGYAMVMGDESERALLAASVDTIEVEQIKEYFTLLVTGLSQKAPLKEMRVIRRISSASKDIPRRQILGPTSDYTLRLLDFELLNDSKEKRKEYIRALFKDIEPLASSLF